MLTNRRPTIFRPLTAFALLLIGSFTNTGCGRYYLQTPPVYPSDASGSTVSKALQLSGGQITRFIPRPGAYDDPADNTLLAALPKIHVPGHTAQSAVIDFNAGGHGHAEAHALIVGKETLVILEDVMRQGFGGLISPVEKSKTIQVKGRFVSIKTYGPLPLFGNLRLPILLPPDSKTALIGTTQVTLRHPNVWVPLQYGKDRGIQGGGGTVMTLSDFLMLVNKRDAMLGWHTGTTISQVKIVQK